MAADKQQDSTFRRLPISGRHVGDEEKRMLLAGDKGTGETKRQNRNVEWMIGADDEEDEEEVDEGVMVEAKSFL